MHKVFGQNGKMLVLTGCHQNFGSGRIKPNRYLIQRRLGQPLEGGAGADVAAAVGLDEDVGGAKLQI